jgi:hypothetical protein
MGGISWCEVMAYAGCFDTWLQTLDPAFRRRHGVAIEELGDTVVYGQLQDPESRPIIGAAVEALSAIADEARADSGTQASLAWLFASEPRLRDLGALFVHAALRRARRFLRVQRFYPAVMLQRILDAIDRQASDDAGSRLVWAILERRDSRAVIDAVVAAAAPMARGYDDSIAWPTAAQAGKLLRAVEALQAPWSEVTSSLLHLAESSAAPFDPAVVARLASVASAPDQPLRDLVAEVHGGEPDGRGRRARNLLGKALAWPSRTAQVLRNLAAEHGVQRLYYAFSRNVLGGIDAAVRQVKDAEGEPVTPQRVGGVAPELFVRDCVWPLAIAMDGTFDGQEVELFSDEPHLDIAGRARLSRQRALCLAAELSYIDDDTMEMLDDIHELYYR